MVTDAIGVVVSTTISSFITWALTHDVATRSKRYNLTGGRKALRVQFLTQSSFRFSCINHDVGLQSEHRGLASQLGMWSIPWIWHTTFSWPIFIPRGWQSIVILSVFNVVAYTFVFWLRGE